MNASSKSFVSWLACCCKSQLNFIQSKTDIAKDQLGSGILYLNKIKFYWIGLSS